MALFDSVRAAIANDLTAALKANDRLQVGALRCALNALDNATAVAPEASFEDPAGPEVPRRAVGRAKMSALLLAAVQEWAAAANQYDRLGHGDRAAHLRREAEVIRGCLRHLGDAAGAAS